LAATSSVGLVCSKPISRKSGFASINFGAQGN
jgi:hypothetical protein